MSEDIIINIENDLQGREILTIEKDGYSYPLNSRVDAESAAEIYSARYANNNFFNTIFLFGFSDGRVIRSLLHNIDEGGTIIVFEPSEEIFTRSRNVIDISDILMDKRVIVTVGADNLFTIYSQNIAQLPVSMRKSFQYAILPNYDVIFPEVCRKWQNLIFDDISKTYMNLTTLIATKDTSVNNFINNMPLLIKSSDIAMLISGFQRYELKDVPVVIVGAGPSLDKNVFELKGMEDKVFIVATDAAVKTLVKYHIKCHLIINVDVAIKAQFFDDEDMQNAGLVLRPNADPSIFSTHKEHNFISYTYYDVICDGIFGKTLDHGFPGFSTGGSVSCEAYTLVKLLGFKKIIFIGQDLAFTGGKVHTETFSETYNKDDKEIYNEASKIIVEDWDGHPIETDYPMDSYIKWFNKHTEIDKKDGIIVYDATEGGAKKANCIRITLKQALDTLATKSVDFYSIINHTRKTFNRRGKSVAVRKMRKLPVRLRKLKSEIYQKKQYFYKSGMEFENRANDKEFLQKILDYLQNSMSFGKNDALFTLITLQNGGADYILNEVSFDTNMDFKEVLMTYSRYYEKYYETCEQLIKLVEEDWKNI